MPWPSVEPGQPALHSVNSALYIAVRQGNMALARLSTGPMSHIGYWNRTVEGTAFQMDGWGSGHLARRYFARGKSIINITGVIMYFPLRTLS